ncbi:MAG: ferric reductase-like transmembrane domain-containing protein [Propionibacteriaceae bacterium]|nr:ferric reductase-like transmembrane domain-containing protein [Propionibacteriaceae bacterium]
MVTHSVQPQPRRAWLGGAGYAAVLLAPLLIIALPPHPPSTTFWRELSVALGFAGMAIMGAQFIPTARLPVLRDVYPSDTLYKHHRQIAQVGFLFALAHPVILFISTPSMLELLNPVTAPWRARAAVAGVVVLLVLVGTSIWRTALKLSYPVWRTLHVVLTAAVAVLFLWHMFGVNRYLAHPVMRAYWIAMAVCWLIAVLYARVIRPLLIARRPYVVAEVRPERGNTWTLSLRPQGHPGLRFMAGQFAWISVDKSPFTLSDNPFSFSSSSERVGQVEFAISDNGDFSSQVKHLEPGTEVLLDGPFGTFDLDQHAGDPERPAAGYVFIAGGSGVVPIMSILRTMHDRNDQTPSVLFHASDSREAATFREEIDTLDDRLMLTVVPVVADPEPDYDGETGHVTKNVLERHLPEPLEGAQYFVCGPPVMIDAVWDALDSLGVPRAAIHTEHYVMA